MGGYIIARIKTTVKDGKVEQRCRKCGNDHVECWYWGPDQIDIYNNAVNGQKKEVKYKQYWECWDCSGLSAGFAFSDDRLNDNSEEWVALE